MDLGKAGGGSSGRAVVREMLRLCLDPAANFTLAVLMGREIPKGVLNVSVTAGTGRGCCCPEAGIIQPLLMDLILLQVTPAAGSRGRISPGCTLQFAFCLKNPTTPCFVCWNVEKNPKNIKAPKSKVSCYK